MKSSTNAVNYGECLSDKSGDKQNTAYIFQGEVGHSHLRGSKLRSDREQVSAEVGEDWSKYRGRG